MAPVHVGLIGCGRIVQLVHLNILTRLPNVKLVALAESDPQRRAEAAGRAPAAAALASYEELIARPDVEAVVICVPTGMHAQVAQAAFEQGKHVYLEKPLATSLAEAQPVLDSWRTAGTVGMIGFNYRFNEMHRTARRYIAHGRLGTVQSVRSVFTSAARALPPWKMQRQTGGGVLLDLASHHIDLFHFLFDQPISEVFADITSRVSEDDTAMLHMRLADGLPVQSFFSMQAVDADRFEVYGDAAKVAVDRQRGWSATLTDTKQVHANPIKHLLAALPGLLQSPYIRTRLLAPGSEPSFAVALAHFATAIRDRGQVYPDLWDGYRSLAVIEAAEESARTQQVTRVASELLEAFAPVHTSGS